MSHLGVVWRGVPGSGALNAFDGTGGGSLSQRGSELSVGWFGLCGRRPMYARATSLSSGLSLPAEAAGCKLRPHTC